MTLRTSTAWCRGPDPRQVQCGAGQGQETSRFTVEQYLERWLAIVKPTVEPGTYAPYKRHCDLHLSPHIGTVKLTTLTSVHVEGLYATLAEKGVSPAMRRKIGTTFTVALGQAVRMKLLPYNPAAGVRKPKATKPEIQVLDSDQISRFLKEAAKDRLAAFYIVALDGGARPGELFALTWADVDFDRGQLSINKSIEDIGGRRRVKEVKTKQDRRRIDLSPFTLAELNRHRARMLVEGRDVKQGIVFCNTVGTYLRPGEVHDAFKAALKRAELPAIRLYDLRHTCATLLLLADENPKVVSERLGHSSIHLTLDTYSHVLPTMQKRAAEKIGKILGRRAVNG